MCDGKRVVVGVAIVFGSAVPAIIDWHVLGDRRVSMPCRRAGMARYTGAFVQDLDRGVGDARLELLADEA